MKSMAGLLDLYYPIICPPSRAFPAKTYRAATAILLLCLALTICGGEPVAHGAAL